MKPGQYIQFTLPKTIPEEQLLSAIKESNLGPTIKKDPHGTFFVTIPDKKTTSHSAIVITPHTKQNRNIPTNSQQCLAEDEVQNENIPTNLSTYFTENEIQKLQNQVLQYSAGKPYNTFSKDQQDNVFAILANRVLHEEPKFQELLADINTFFFETSANNNDAYTTLARIITNTQTTTANTKHKILIIQTSRGQIPQGTTQEIKNYAQSFLEERPALQQSMAYFQELNLQELQDHCDKSLLLPNGKTTTPKQLQQTLKESPSTLLSLKNQLLQSVKIKENAKNILQNTQESINKTYLIEALLKSLPQKVRLTFNAIINPPQTVTTPYKVPGLYYRTILEYEKIIATEKLQNLQQNTELNSQTTTPNTTSPEQKIQHILQGLKQQLLDYRKKNTDIKEKTIIEYIEIIQKKTNLFLASLSSIEESTIDELLKSLKQKGIINLQQEIKNDKFVEQNIEFFIRENIDTIQTLALFTKHLFISELATLLPENQQNYNKAIHFTQNKNDLIQHIQNIEFNSLPNTEETKETCEEKIKLLDEALELNDQELSEEIKFYIEKNTLQEKNSSTTTEQTSPNNELVQILKESKASLVYIPKTDLQYFTQLNSTSPKTLQHAHSSKLSNEAAQAR